MADNAEVSLFLFDWLWIQCSSRNGIGVRFQTGISVRSEWNTHFSDITTCNLFPYKFFSQQTGKTRKDGFNAKAFILGKFIERQFKKTPLKVSFCTISQKPIAQLDHSINFGKFPFRIFEAKNDNHPTLITPYMKNLYFLYPLLCKLF
ncbi:MAG: hypothetical protein A3F17_01040 [Gammaproteobacteria bacterium RIFCSPHIGHO2_12_FULL_41_15]|nr:MAG: hypothetical protein A3F17_01040 [Gammaproteobacteria bacterium RIFCSPHIGHO2_12_FULL_41_15]